MDAVQVRLQQILDQSVFGGDAVGQDGGRLAPGIADGVGFKVADCPGALDEIEEE